VSTRVAAEAHFADRVLARVRALGHPLCAGLDPHLPLIPPLFRRGSMRSADPQTAAAVESFVLAVLERVAPRVAIVKPQSAFFEQLGWRGVQVLERVIAHARAAGLLVLLDAKRGDIGTTASAYAACLATDAAARVDAVTVNPYLGRDTLQPFLDAAEANGAGVFVLVKTSNPGAADYQDRRIDGRPLFEHVAESLRESAERLRGSNSGWSALGIVAGATYPAESERLRALLPHALFLVPGYGAQGGSARDAVRGFVRDADGHLAGGIVNSSRALLFPPAAATDDVRVWERAIDAACEQAAADLAAAVLRR
jgi:orotidine-5'-phosphate decarboxylase